MMAPGKITFAQAFVLTGVLIGAAIFPCLADTTEERQFDFANGLFRKGYYDMAAEQYRKYLNDYPSGQFVLDALMRLAESEYAANRYEAALQAYEDLLPKLDTQSSNYNKALTRKGELLFRLKRYEEAKSVLTPMTADSIEMETRVTALYYLAKTHAETQDFSNAETLLKKALTVGQGSPLAPFAHYQLALVYLSSNQPEQAAVEFAEAANTSQDEQLRMECRFRAAETYDKIGWFDASITAYQDLLQQFPNTPYAERAAYGLAWALYHANRYDDALKAADTFLKTYPDSADRLGAQYLRGNCLHQKAQYEEAIREYQEIRKNAPDSEFAARAHYRIAWALFQSGKPDDAEREIDAFLARNADSPLRGDVAFLRGLLLVGKNNIQDAYEEFRLVAENYPQSEFAAEALFKAGECLAQQGKIDEAGKVFETFAQKYPEHPLTEQAVLRVGDAQFLSASFENAIAKYRAILEKQPAPATEHEILYRLAVTYHNMQNYQESAATFRRLLEKFPSSPHVAEAHLRIGDFLLRDANKPIEAIPEFEASLNTDPKGPFAGKAMKGLALARYETKDYDGATEMFLRLFREFPDVKLNEKTYAWVGQRLFDQQKWREASEAFGAMLKALPDYPKPERIRLKIAECAEKAGDLDKALQLYDAAVQTSPQSSESVVARWHMAQIYENRNEMDKAIELYETAANVDTSDTAARARFRLGEIAEQKGDFDTAARHYMRIAILLLHEELSPESLLRAARCFEKAGKPDQAKKACEQLVQEYPQSAQAAQAKEQLQRLG
ncbi:MAG TPA: tetratricopeptide repeat protein [Candidatus Hydrogenedentes bacterium]|nr:tetratricopeptide repeat protein [Candidatus Hydrogenedentota bacterium]HOL75925.1 tetratricopeptide repeat protein [Candidatus Hydrogenedentota bacterium]HPO85666.1 tetratricopeptide repeat protein [Candidatus Hydrogenedentota bacterium]